MDRKELINKGAEAVRNTPHLFNIYKQFLIEDWGRLPQGCFQCQFNSYFNKWKNQILSNNIIKMEKQANINKTYVLKDKSANKYLYGEVYSNYSPDEHWIKYLDLKPEGKNLFLVLPEGVSRTDEDQATEEEFKKKELSDLQEQEDVVADSENAELEISEEGNSEEVVSENTEDLQEQEDVVEDKPKRGRKKQD